MASVSEDDIVNLSRSYGLPPELALAVYRQESSSGANTSTSPRKAVGGFQLVPTTFAGMDVGDDINDPYQNAEAGIKYLSQGYRATGGDPVATAAYYHAGPAFAKKLAANPNLNDGSIRTVDYAQQVAAKAKGITVDADRQVDSTSTAPTNAPDTNSAPTLGGPPKRSFALDDLLDQTKDLTASLLSSSADLGEKIKDNLKDQTDNLKKQGDLAATVSLEAFRQSQQKASENAAELSRLGINTSDADSIIAKLSTDLASEYKQSQALRASIQERQNAGVGDMFNPLDPVNSLLGTFSLRDDIREHNRIIQTMDSQKAFVDKATSIASNIAAVNSTKYASSTAQGAAASADLLKEQANEKAMAMQDKLMKVDFDTQVRTLSILTQQVKTQNEIDNAETNKVIRQTAQEAKDVANQKKLAEDKRAQVAGTILGMNINSVDDLKRQTPDVRAAVERVLASGENGQIAASPLEAAQTLQRGNLSNMAPGLASSAKMLTAVAQQARATVDADPRYSTASKQQREEAINKTMTDVIKTAAARPQKAVITGVDGKEINPFQIPEYGVMQTDPNAQNLKLTQILADTKKAMPTLQLDDKMIAELAYANVGKGYKDIGEAAKDITNYYRAGVTRNNNVYRLDALGLPPQTVYQVGGVLGGGVINMLSYPDVMKVLLNKEAEKSNQEAQKSPSFLQNPNNL